MAEKENEANGKENSRNVSYTCGPWQLRCLTYVHYNLLPF